MDDLKWYKKRGGSAGSKGVDFQVDLLTVFLLNASRKLTNWRLSTDNQEAGKFDDIVLEWTEGAVLLQAKSRENRKLTFDELMSTNSNKDDFSLPKYFYSYQEIKTKFPVKNIIICTNTNQIDNQTSNYLNHRKEDSQSMLDLQSDCCSLYVFKEEILQELQTHLEIYYENNLKKTHTKINETITDENLRDFLEKLQFYSGYPSGKDLKQYIDQILIHLSDSDSLWNGASSQNIHNKVKKWFDQKRGEYLTYAHVKALVCETKSDRYCNTLNSFKIHFERNELKFTSSERIFHFIVKDVHLLQVLKIHDALQNNKNTLYVNPEEPVNVQNEIIEAFELPSYEYLVIISPKVEIIDKVKDILNRIVYKKIILVTNPKCKFAQKIASGNSSCIIEERVVFSSLSTKTREMLLKHKNIMFQGKNVSLEEIFTTEQCRYLDQAINSQVLEKLVRSENIKVGSQVLALDEQIACCYVDRKFERKSNGRLETLPEEEIYDVNEKIILIADSAGMGKSTVLTKLAATIKETNPHLWVIRIQLSNHTKTLREFQKQNLEKINCIMELLDSDETTRLTNSLEKFIFLMNEKVVLLLDGVDKVSPDYTKVIMKLLTQCYEASNVIKIFVTTRPHIRWELEEILKVSSFILQPFTMSDQIDFLVNYWAKNLELDNTNKSKCKRYAETLINKMFWWSKFRHYAAIPLHLRMVAEIFQENNRRSESMDWQGCKEYLEGTATEPKLQEKINIAVLYDMFMEKKREVFIIKGNPSGNIFANQALADQFEESLVQHQNLALETILDETMCKLFSCYKQRDEYMETKILRIGIVQKYDNFEFIHRTFAEYFLARTLLKELQLKNENVKLQQYLIDTVLISSGFNITRAFFDSFLQKVVNNLPPDTFQGYQSQTLDVKILKDSLIHLLAKEGCVSILHLLLKCIDFKIVKDKEITFQLHYNKRKDMKKSTPRNTLNFLKLLLQQGGVNIKDEIDRTPLHYAAKAGHLEMVKFLVNAGANINSEDIFHWTPLHFASDCNHFDIVKFFVRQPTGKRTENEGCSTPLQIAIFKGHVNVATCLLKDILVRNGPNVNDCNTLYAIAYLGYLDILQALPNLEEIVNARIWNSQTLIFGAALGRQPDTFKYLIQMGADINIKDKSGNTVLHTISKKHAHASIAEDLIDLGIDVNSKNLDGDTALHIAAEHGVHSMVELLVENGADINSKNNIGRTAFYLAVLKKDRQHTVTYLVSQGADVSVRDENGRTVLHIASMVGSLRMIKVFVKVGVDVNVKDNDGLTALNQAILFRHWEIAKFLVESGTDVNGKSGRENRTVLHIVISFGLRDMIKFLVTFGADVNVQDFLGLTALHMVVLHYYSNVLEAVRLLVENGADINILDNLRRTPLDIARLRGQRDIVEYLEERGGIANLTNGQVST